jgi:hypothetical protein
MHAKHTPLVHLGCAWCMVSCSTVSISTCVQLAFTWVPFKSVIAAVEGLLQLKQPPLQELCYGRHRLRCLQPTGVAARVFLHCPTALEGSGEFYNVLLIDCTCLGGVPHECRCIFECSR